MNIPSVTNESQSQIILKLCGVSAEAWGHPQNTQESSTFGGWVREKYTSVNMLAAWGCGPEDFWMHRHDVIFPHAG